MGKNEVSDGGGKKLADYALFFDLFSTIGVSKNEREVIDGIAGVFHTICTPAYVAYLPFNGDRSGSLKCRPRLASGQEMGIAERLAGFDKEYAWTASDKGFVMRVSYAGEKLGVIELEGMAFPEYREHYLNLALNLAAVLGLTISNARNYHALEEKNKELASSERLFRQLTDASFEGILIHIEGKVVDCNSIFARMFGYAQNEIIGKNALDLAPPESQAILLDHMRRESEERYDVMGLKKDGTPIFIEIQGRNILYHGQKARITAVRDITDRKAAVEKLKAAKEEAEEATRLKDKFITLVSHDLKSPFVSIATIVETIKLDAALALSPKQEELLNEIQSISGNSLKMVNELLSLQRLTTGKIILQRQFSDAHTIALLACMQHQNLAEIKGISLENKIPKHSWIYSDSSLLAGVIHNLVNNAVKSCGKGDSITLFIPPGRKTTVAVKDTGTGIAPHLLPHLFKGDIVASMRGTDGEEETGLGLPNCAEIMKAHGGVLSVESREGEGSVFFAELPYVEPSLLLVSESGPTIALFQSITGEYDIELSVASDIGGAKANVNKSRICLVIIDAEHLVQGEIRRQLERFAGEGEFNQLPCLPIMSEEDYFFVKKQYDMDVGGALLTPLSVEKIEAVLNEYLR